MRDSDEKDLWIKKADTQNHPNGVLWTNDNPYENNIFRHFSGGDSAIIESRIPELVQVAAIHGWTVSDVNELFPTPESKTE